MKVLCVIDCLGSGGAQRQLVNLALGLKARGHCVEFFTYFKDDHFKDRLDEGGIRVHLALKDSRFSFKPLMALRRLLKEQRYTHVLAYLETPSVYAELACISLSGVRLLVSERNTVPDGKVTWTRSAKSQLHRCASFIVTNSYAHSDWLSKQFGYLRPKIRMIWNSVNTQEFHPSIQNRCRDHTLKLLGVGRISPQKNLVRLATALSECLKQGISVSLDWAGRIESQKEYLAVCNTILKNQISARWSWLGERKDIPELMRQCDALIIPSLYEGLPNVGCEALACGLPLLASRVSDNARLVGAGERGLTFQPECPKSIAQAISDMSKFDMAKRIQMGQAGRSFAENHLSIEACVEAYLKLLVGASSCSVDQNAM